MSLAESICQFCGILSATNPLRPVIAVIRINGLGEVERCIRVCPKCEEAARKAAEETDD